MMLRGAVTLAFMLAAQSLAAQAPTIAASATAFRPLLPVLDDFGQVIPEDSIHMTMRPPKVRTLSLIAVAGLGALVFNGLRPEPPRSADCSIYEPCTPREKFYKDKAAAMGAIVGFMFGFAVIPDGRIDRWQAVEILRARRRFQRESTTPP